MGCCDIDLESEFTDGVVARDLRSYRRHGLPGVSRRIVDALVAEGVEGRTLLDIGGGVGGIQHELIRAGVREVTDVDGSARYLAAAREEARRQGHLDRIAYRHADFVEIAGDVEPADVVTLIAVLCCYPRMEALLAAAARRAGRHLAIVYPRSTWWMRAAAAAFRALQPLLGAGPGYVHPEQGVDAVVRRAGLVAAVDRSDWYWKAVVYRRSAPATR